MSREAAFQAMAVELGYDFNGEIKIGGNYSPFVRHGSEVYVSGQIPRVGNEVVVTGRVGEEVSLERAQLAAKVSAMRALALLRQALVVCLAPICGFCRLLECDCGVANPHDSPAIAAVCALHSPPIHSA